VKLERCFDKILSQITNGKIQGKVAIDIYRACGVFKSDCKEHLEAINLFNKALEIDPSNSEMHFFIGYEYGLMNNDEMGLKYLKKAAELGSNEASDYIDENYR
jgi:tetratricopeptide (TPR) repeat protein